jgi:hypothetical protein
MVQTRRRMVASEETAVETTDKEDDSTELATDKSIPTVSNFILKGKSYDSYEEMVKAKRRFNNEMLKKSGLLEAAASFRDKTGGGTTKKAQASQRGLRADRKRKDPAIVLPKRKSSRIAGAEADGIFIADERSGGRVVIGGAGSSSQLMASKNVYLEEQKDKFYNNRVNDGSDLTIEDTVELTGYKWKKDNSVENCKTFAETLLTANDKKKNTQSSSSSKMRPAFTLDQVDKLRVDNQECVAKVVPDRIHSVAFHPSEHKLIAATGDKKGFLGLWDVDASSKNSDTDGVHLFKPHAGAINSLEWNKSGSELLSLSYDGTIRLFDINRQVFTEAFSAYDDSAEFKDKLGYGMDEGSRFYTQYACYDHRNEKCLFLSTSTGGVAHIDLRAKGKLTYDLSLSEKKINSIR